MDRFFTDGRAVDLEQVSGMQWDKGNPRSGRLFVYLGGGARFIEFQGPAARMLFDAYVENAQDLRQSVGVAG